MRDRTSRDGTAEVDDLLFDRTRIRGIEPPQRLFTDLVERMHRTIQLRPGPLGKSTAEATRGITGFVYRTVDDAGAPQLVAPDLDLETALVAYLRCCHR